LGQKDIDTPHKVTKVIIEPKTEKTSEKPESRPLEVGPRAICVALAPNGKAIKVTANNPAELISTLQSSTLAWVNFVVSDLEKDGTEIAVKLGYSESLVRTILKGYYASFEDRDTEIGIMVPAVKISGLEIESFPLLVLVRKDLIVTIHSSEVERLVLFSRYADGLIRKLPPTMPQLDKLTLMLVRILDENNTHNFEHLREIEEQADAMSKMLLDPSAGRMEVGRNIYQMKHALITYLNNLWRTLDVLNSLRFGDAQLVSDDPKTLARVGLLVEDVNRQIALSEHMSEVLASGLEVLQALYNNQLQVMNNRFALTMTWLTILGTAVLVPNTLATIFGSMAGLSSSELFFYLFILTISTVNATVLAWWWVMRKVHITKSPM